VGAGRRIRLARPLLLGGLAAVTFIDLPPILYLDRHAVPPSGMSGGAVAKRRQIASAVDVSPLRSDRRM
jgi:hypothetical protein